MSGIGIDIGLGVRRRRRGTTWLPSALTGVVAWWRADLGVTVATGVSSWVDQIGGVAATNATGAQQPALTAVSSVGSQPAVTFDGTDDSLANAATSLGIAAGSAYSVLCVGRMLAVPNVSRGPIFALRSTGIRAVTEFRQVPDMVVHVDEVNGGANCFLSTANSTAVATAIQLPFQSVHKMTGAGNGVTVYVNGTAYTTTSGAQHTETGAAGFAIGISVTSNIRWLGHIAELVIVNGAISDVDRAAWGTYVASRYGI